MTDYPKSLRDETIRRQRVAMLDRPHIRNFTSLVKEIRRHRRQEGFPEERPYFDPMDGETKEVPYFDPKDGGKNARALFLLQAPGREAVRSGFVSRDNPDPTAKNMLDVLQEAGLSRNETVLWNIVPWYLGSCSKIRKPTKSDIEEGKAYVPRLLEILPRLKVVALFGLDAQRIEAWLESSANRRFKVFRVRHPSQQSMNRHPGNRDLLLESLRTVRQFLSL